VKFCVLSGIEGEEVWGMLWLGKFLWIWIRVWWAAGWVMKFVYFVLG